MILSRLEIIRGLIGKSVKELEGEKNISFSYLNTELFEKLEDEIEMMAEHFGHPPVDSFTRREMYTAAVKEYTSLNPVTIAPHSSLVKKGYKSWLTQERKDAMKSKWHYSDRYFRYLKTKGRSEKVIESNKEICEDILGKLGDPKLPLFFKKGLVVGSVQSGKTENFNGVINYAIDSGYRLIIVLSGIIDDLRIQTQKRIESDVIGRGIIDEVSDKKGRKGVGEIEQFGPKHKTEQVNCITSYRSDFNRNLLDADFSLDNLNILVCKKNVGILKNLLIWLDDCLVEGATTFDIPLLIVDDEADNASLNNIGSKGPEYATKTNGHIRAILALFTRKTYLGYTATPFANVIQDQNEAPSRKWPINYSRNGESIQKEFRQVDNIFPEDFIELLNPPSTYIGAKSIFETVNPIDNALEEKLPVLSTVDDYIENFPSKLDRETEEGVEAVADKQEFERSSLVFQYSDWSDYRRSTRASRRDDEFPKALPKSLKEAVACFIMTIAVRELRAPDMIHSRVFCPHHTMLIHVSRFIPWQNRTKKFIQLEVDALGEKLMNDSPNATDSVYKYFHDLWYKYYALITANILNYLPNAYVDPYLAQVTFKSIRRKLASAADGLSVKALNSDPSNQKDELHYNDRTPQKVIAIGGNRLSRGFTLEGLTVNYLIRPAGCADTLLQMGRWFGYRPGYIDCCKIFTTPQLRDRFDLTTLTIEELEGEFKKMKGERKTPREFELRVRRHPGVLKITRPSILKGTKGVKWSYQDQLFQNTIFSVKKDDIIDSWESFRKNVVQLHNFTKEKDFWIADADWESAVKLIKSIKNLDGITKNCITKFIELANSKGGKLSDWKFAIKNTGNGRPLPADISGLPFDIDNQAIRRGPKEGSDFRTDFIGRKKLFYATGKNRNIVSSAKDLALFLDDDEQVQAENDYIEERKNFYLQKNPNWSSDQALKKAKAITIPEHVYRRKMSDRNALIVIYLLDAESVFRQDQEGSEDKDLKKVLDKEGIDLDIPLVGYAIGFPPINPDPGAEYVTGDYDRADNNDQDIDKDDDPLLEDRST
ncbi:Z1 domain-containing protein [Akkermansiaceae bacterium]|nr:Z1 domain-containing protein [Akkermansiaceae bacterium]